MVRIINGEIVPDNDPRVRGSRSGSGTGYTTSSSGGAATRRVHTIASMNQSAQQDTSSNSSGRGSRGGSLRQEQLAGGGGGGGPEMMLQRLAGALGVEGKTVTIPAVFGMPPREVEYVYLILAGIVGLLFGLKGLAISVVAYLILTHKPRQHDQ